MKKQAVALSGERGYRELSGQTSISAGLLVGVLEGLGGASQEDQQPATFIEQGVGKKFSGEVKISPLNFFVFEYTDY